MSNFTPESGSLQQPDVPQKLLLGIPEVASTLGCGRSFIYQLIGEGELHAIKLGRLTRIPSSDLNAMIERKLMEFGGNIR